MKALGAVHDITPRSLIHIARTSSRGDIMYRPEWISIERHLTKDEPDRLIKTEENYCRVLKRQYFVHHSLRRTVKEAAKLAGKL